MGPREYGARPLPVAAAPDLHRLVAALAQRADLPVQPRLYYVPTRMLNAFAVGRRDDAAIAVTDGLLRGLTGREVAGVLAHEISHARADDLWVMTLADMVGRLTHALAYAGLLLLIVGLPFLAAGTVWPVVTALALTLVPAVMTLLQLALSRSREYEADGRPQPPAGYTRVTRPTRLRPRGSAGEQGSRTPEWNVTRPPRGAGCGSAG